MKSNTNYLQGTYIPVNKSKYMGKGDPYYRSSYEKRVFVWADFNKNILRWSSESIAIPYLFEVDNKFHRYYPDVIADIRDKTGKVTKYIIEIKPHKQTLPPQKPMNKNKKRQERYTYEMVRWIKNNNKWIATVRYCKKHGYEFKILTEKHIFK